MTYRSASVRWRAAISTTAARFCDLLVDQIEINALAVHFALGHAREVEHVFNEIVHPFRGVFDAKQAVS